MRISDIIEDKSFRKLRSEINSFSKKALEEYIRKLDRNWVYTESKELFDPVWGPVSFNAGEIAILDCPIIQRLRRIKQLGLASYVYPEADYSRFAHTIGVFKLAGDMSEIVGRQLTSDDKEYYCQVVRLAALFHDCGHMYYSHVSEYYFTENEKNSRYDEIKKALIYFGEKIDTKIALHEVISILVVKSPYVKKLLKLVSNSLEGHINNSDDQIEKLTECICCLILGQANDEKLLPYCQIINGPVDADRCDYLSRDSHATNVPAAVDIYRLVHKIGVCYDKLPKGIIPNDSQLWEGINTDSVYFATIKNSAVEALNHLFITRSIMYNSVYYHQKVRTIENMFRMVLEELDLLGNPIVSDFDKIMQTTDEVFGDYFVQAVCDGDDVEKYKGIERAINDINYRSLMKRVCSVNANDLIDREGEEFFNFERDIIMVSNKEKFSELETATNEEYKKICSLLKKKDVYNHRFRIVEFPKKETSQPPSNIVVSLGDGSIKNYSEIFQTSTWIDSRDSKNKAQYLITDADYRDLAFLAFQKALIKKYKVVIKPTAANCSKVSLDEILKQKKRLLSCDYYDVADYYFRELEEKIASICTKYKTYEGKDGYTINREHIISFISQFFWKKMNEKETRLLINGVLDILASGLFINRREFISSMEKLIKKSKIDNEKIYICPLGNGKDSAGHLAYYFNDLDKSKYNFEVFDSLQEVLGRTNADDHIVFFDDGAYSGTQLISIFEEYVGVPFDKRKTKEQHVKPLSGENILQLKNRKISIIYICFNSENKNSVKMALNKLGVNVIDIEYMHDMQKKILESDEIIKQKNQRDLIKNIFTEIGRELLLSTKKTGKSYKEGWSEERIQRSTLGYNDAQQMVILKDSVPTYTISLFWMSDGVYNGRKWKPLFYRTVKDNKEK